LIEFFLSTVLYNPLFVDKGSGILIIHFKGITKRI